MSHVIITLNIVLVFLYQLSVTQIANLLYKRQNVPCETPPEAIFWVFILSLLMPELVLILSSKARIWITKGFEKYNAGVMTIDIKALMTHYSTSVFIRLYGVMVLTNIWYKINFDFEEKLIVMLSAFGLEGFQVLKSVLENRKVA